MDRRSTSTVWYRVQTTVTYYNLVGRYERVFGVGQEMKKKKRKKRKKKKININD